MMRARWSVCAAAIAIAACDRSPPAPAPAVAPAPTVAPVAIPPAPAVVDAWNVAAVGIEPIVLAPSIAARCDRPMMVVGTSAAYFVDDAAPVPVAGAAVDATLVSALEDGVAIAWRWGLSSGAYDGPGGEPLFDFRVDQPVRATVLLDRRLSPARLAAVLRSVDALGMDTLVLAGVDVHGQPTCFLTLRDASLDGAPASRLEEAELAPDGRWHMGAPQLTDTDAERAVVRARRAPGTTVESLIRSAAGLPGPRRWPILVEPAP